MPRLTALNAQWRRNPPVPLMIKAYLGIKDGSSAKDKMKMPGLATLPDIEE
jgi:hypothetical protein